MVLSLVLGVGPQVAMAKSKSVKKKKIVHIEISSSPRSSLTRTPQAIGQRRIRNYDQGVTSTDLEPLSSNKKSKRGLGSEWNRQTERMKNLLMRGAKKKNQAERQEDETKKIDAGDLNKILDDLKGFSEDELLSEYEGSI